MTLRMDGRPITLEGPATLLEAARANGIVIPSLCDHPDLAPYAACRICLVEVKGRKGLVPACSTRAEDGMDVVTASPEILALRRGILELILAEHPLACLICAEKASCDDLKSTIRKTEEVTGCVLCPANADCELQRVAAAVGVEVVPYPFRRRSGEVRRDDPFIDRDNALCILCGRCVRVCHEVRGADVLTFVSRGSETVIGTALDRRLADSGCRFCGACVDVCPTGSLSERATRYDRPAEAEGRTICTLCSQGCGLIVRTREDRVLRTKPDPASPVNRGQACVKGRFLVRSALAHPNRLLKPLVREAGALREAGWDEALALAAERLAAAGPGRSAVAASAESSCEDLFVLHRLAAEVLKAPAIAGPWSRSATAALGDLGRTSGRALPPDFRLDDIDRAGTIIVAGEDLPVTQPIVGVRVHRAAAAGAALIRIDGWRDLRGLAGKLRGTGPVLVLFGPAVFGIPRWPAFLGELWDLTISAGGRIAALDRESNARGGLALARAFRSRTATDGARAFYIAGPTAPPRRGRGTVVIAQACYADEVTASADIVLPEATSFEAEGAFVNVEGRIQVSPAVVAPPGEARPGWWILKEMAARLGAPGFSFASAAEVRTALAAAVPAFASVTGAEGGGAFLAEGRERPAPAGGLEEGRPGRVKLADPDDWKGLRLASENKGLKLVRGR